MRSAAVPVRVSHQLHKQLASRPSHSSILPDPSWPKPNSEHGLNKAARGLRGRESGLHSVGKRNQRHRADAQNHRNPECAL